MPITSQPSFECDHTVDTLLNTPWQTLAIAAQQKRATVWGTNITYSRKVFIPLTKLCRDVCHYCTFAQTPRALARQQQTKHSVYLSPQQVLEIARQGQQQGCKEALFTLGDQPELRYSAARDALRNLGFETTLEYLGHVAQLVLEETGLLPHLNPGLMQLQDYQRLRQVAPSMGIMLETSAQRLGDKGGPHYGSPDKDPQRRLASLASAGLAKVAMTSGVLIGIGETRLERLQSIVELKKLALQYGHIQEVIVQNFKAKADTKMARFPEPSMEELCWTIACARVILPAEVSLQAPPNLFDGNLGQLIEAGINDWGGVSPVTPDHVNPEAPWPHLDALAKATQATGHELVERLTVYPRFTQQADTWLAPGVRPKVLKLSDSSGLARVGQWAPGACTEANQDDLNDIASGPFIARRKSAISQLLEKHTTQQLTQKDIAQLFSARGQDFADVCRAANNLRKATNGDTVSYAVVRNINYTNICQYQCSFCAFSKGKRHDHLRGKPYLLEPSEIIRRVNEAWARGATEVCMQGGIHPQFTGETYLDLCHTVKQAQPNIHMHAFSPLEVAHGAKTLGMSVQDYLQALKSAGLNSMPGTAAEILNDDIRRQLAPDKMLSNQWLDIIRQAHNTGLATTATIMFGHIDNYQHWAEHLLRIDQLQQETGGFTEFVPLPFVHMEAPMFLRGQARKGPTLRETILMHAVARLVLSPGIKNIQVSWVKVGQTWASHCLNSGANDLGGTLMNESISRAAGASHGQELDAAGMECLIKSLGRMPLQRTTLYSPACSVQHSKALSAPALIPVTNAMPSGNASLTANLVHPKAEIIS
ncbi:5-amino-6-(D-ribitylamino)uracil--L-tyrosine 4-hydroxyphenyl transferase CofH [Halioxenophilus aromaticivorans]|uniref:FO synthase n=1 Tax=Halioxenophilus aromaticivorans TaxID=1306992 RepID=A0AAV3U443_9ALTE